MYILLIEKHQLDPSSRDSANNSGYFPSWPQLNQRGVYEMDRNQRENSQFCSKNYRGHPNLLPGIFTVYCQHEICYGFEIMDSPESVNVPFKIMRTRFPEAPEAIIYDNSGYLHQYALNRDPGFFKETKFLVDRFHWKNHKACADSYNVSLHVDFTGVNAQIIEQRNATLKNLKSQLSYMNEVNFTSHLKPLLWHCNKRVKNEESR